MTAQLQRGFALAALCAALACPARPARAQSMADMSGIPLPDSGMADGTVTVRVVGGSFSEPVVGVDVTVAPADGEPRVARTDAEGRATLPGLTAGGEYVASASIGGKELRSRAFAIPPKGGVRLLLSPGGGQGAVTMRSPGSMGSSRQSPFEVSGRPQPNQSLPVGVLQVQLLRGGWKNRAAGAVAHVIGFHSDGRVTKVSKVSDKKGRVRFDGLAPLRAAYFAVAVLPHEGGDDRLQSLPIVLSAASGTSVVLAGRAEGADAPAPRDDLDRLYIDQEKPPTGPGPGQVVVRLRGQQAAIEGVQELEILEVGKPEAAAKTPKRAVASQAGAVRSNVFAPMKSKHPAGSLAVMVVRADADTTPVPGAEVRLRAVGVDGEQEGTTDAEGVAVFADLETGTEYQVAAIVQGERVEAPPVALPAEHGMLVPIGVEWGKAKRYEARFSSIPAAPDKVYMVRAESGGNIYHSPPFQLTAGTGATVAIPLFPNQDLRFHIAGSLDDLYMHFQGMFTVSHGSFVPLDPGPDGFLIPLPKSFAGASVPEELSRQVTIVKGRGLLWTGVIPPGGIELRAAFTVPVDDGAFDLDMDLPHGALNSDVRIQHSQGMQVRVGGNLGGDVEQMSDGRSYFVVSDINLPPEQRLLVKVSGMPHLPKWRRQVRVAAGIVALLLVVWAIFAVVLRKRVRLAAEPGTDRRERLLDDLVALERRKRAGQIAGARYQRAREKLVHELEPLYADDSAAGGAGSESRTA